LLEAVVLEDPGAEVEELFAIRLYIQAILRREVHTEEDLQVGGNTFSLLGSKAWQLLEIGHEAIIPELKSETELLVELSSKPVGLI
jgi:hypothetical protein